MVKKWQKDHNISRNLVSKIEKRDWGRGEREREREREIKVVLKTNPIQI